MHVHTIHSGMCTVPVMRSFCRECYTEPEALYEGLKRLRMDLVTVTDHDSIDAAEPLRRHDDFFLSEEVTCTMPSGTGIHLGVYDITEAQHVAIQRRRQGLRALLGYLDEQGLFFTISHVFSSLTGRRDAADFDWFALRFPGFETLNGHMLQRLNRRSAEMAAELGKAPVGGSDAHTLESAGRAWTEVAGARTKKEFVAAVRGGRAGVAGEAGSYVKLTRDVLRICVSMAKENPATLVAAPLALLVPLVTAGNYVTETVFGWRWAAQLRRSRRAGTVGRQPDASPAV